MSPPDTLLLDARSQTLFECGATLLALLAFPSVPDAERAEIAASLCASHLQAKFKESGDPNELVKAKYAFRDPERIRKDLKILDRLVRDRMVAAKVAVPFLQEALGHLRLSINQLAEFVMGEAKQSIPENFKDRVWRPTLPVIHLAAAVAVAINDRERAGEERTSYGNLIADVEFIFDVLRYAREFETVIKTNKLKISAKKLVSIHYA